MYVMCMHYMHYNVGSVKDVLIYILYVAMVVNFLRIKKNIFDISHVVNLLFEVNCASMSSTNDGTETCRNIHLFQAFELHLLTECGAKGRDDIATSHDPGPLKGSWGSGKSLDFREI